MAAIRDAYSVLRSLVGRRELRERRQRELFFRFARRFTPALAARSGDGVIFVSTSDEYVGRTLFLEGGHQDAALAEAFRVVASADGLGVALGANTMVEVGANIGSTTVSAILRFGVRDVVAFEPHPSNASLLRHNLLANGLTDRVVVHEIAVSDSDGTMPMSVSEENSGDHRLVTAPDSAIPDAYGESARTTIDVPVRSWDSLVAEGLIDLGAVGVVWVDVQGHEGHFLAGAKTLTASSIPVVIEYWPYGLRKAGGLNMLEEIVAARYERFVDLHSLTTEPPATMHAGAIATLVDRYRSPEAHTDLVLIPCTSA